MTEANPKEHDKLFKWMLTDYTEDFFAYFFPDVTVRDYLVLDKEFYQELAKEEAAVASDLLLLMEVALEGQIWDILIVIELKTYVHRSRPTSAGRSCCVENPCGASPFSPTMPSGGHRFPTVSLSSTTAKKGSSMPRLI